ncbi:MAG: beta-ketoacyl synthase chain length factor [Bacteroidales bacterium]|nr:beta-ketoacyl synthase chain length factor [Bacteroidales bacterium]
MDIFIQSAAQISIQNPLCDDWFENPIAHTEGYNRSIEPDYKPFINPMAARRMGKLIKRAIATSISAKQSAGLEQVDAIITGTGLGCIENTEKFLSAMVNEGEQFLQPTYFMQSTHNTISSQIALNQKCNGYNCTYSHRGTSFESGLSDALQQMLLGRINNALVGGHDEMTPDYYNMLGKIGYWKQGEHSEQILRQSSSKGSFAGETSVALIVGTNKTAHTLCKLQDVDLLYKPSETALQDAVQRMLQHANLQPSDIDALMLGLSGDCEYDAIYTNFANAFGKNTPIAWYKHIFGESFTAPAFGVYAAATCLAKERVPSHLLHNQKNEVKSPRNILLYNHFQNIDHSLILLSKC